MLFTTVIIIQILAFMNANPININDDIASNHENVFKIPKSLIAHVGETLFGHLWKASMIDEENLIDIHASWSRDQGSDLASTHDHSYNLDDAMDLEGMWLSDLHFDECMQNLLKNGGIDSKFYFIYEIFERAFPGVNLDWEKIFKRILGKQEIKLNRLDSFLLLLPQIKFPPGKNLDSKPPQEQSNFNEAISSIKLKAITQKIVGMIQHVFPGFYTDETENEIPLQGFNRLLQKYPIQRLITNWPYGVTFNLDLLTNSEYNLLLASMDQWSFTETFLSEFPHEFPGTKLQNIYFNILLKSRKIPLNSGVLPKLN